MKPKDRHRGMSFFGALAETIMALHEAASGYAAGIKASR